MPICMMPDLSIDTTVESLSPLHLHRINVIDAMEF